MMLQINLEHVVVLYGAKGGGEPIYALDDVSLSLGVGEMLAVLGGPKAGKTTLLRVLGCLERPARGVYRIEGRPVQDQSPEALQKLRSRMIGYVAQRPALLAEDTALQNVAAPMLYDRMTDSLAQAEAMAEELLADMGASQLARRPGASLTGEARQRVALARALACDPPIVLVDEPSAGLLPLLHTLHARGKTVIYATRSPALTQDSPRQVRLVEGMLMG